MKIACIVLASGKSERFNKSTSKLFFKVYGTPIIEYTLKKLINHINRNSLYITIPKKITKKEKNLLSRYSNNKLIKGGNSRLQSLKNALFSIDAKKYEYVMVHDGARPNIDNKIIKITIKEIIKGKYDCLIPETKIEDTLRKNRKIVDRSKYTTYQTPQIFKTSLLQNSIKKTNKNVTDDFGIIKNVTSLKIKFIEHGKDNIKITKLNDIKIFKDLIQHKFKIGNGFDIHKLMKGNCLSIGGLKIKSKYTSIGHSDGDVVLHSLIDALLGATNKGDIGKYFPNVKKYKDISSILLLDEIKKLIKIENIIIDNLDCTIICQKIRLEKYKKIIENSLASMLNCKKANINVKAKTADNIGIIGNSKAIACWTTIKLIQI